MSYPTEACSAAYGHLPHDWRTATKWSRCPGIKIDAATRARPVAERRHVLAELRWIKDRLARKISRWAVTGVDLDGGRWVPRRVDDFPENSADAWVQLALTCRDSIAELHTLQTYALAQAREVEAFEKRRATAIRESVKALRVGA